MRKRAAMFLAVWFYAFCADQTFGRVNLALNKPAFESSSHGSYAEMANDGNRIAQRSSGTCSHTKGEMAPWWTVDLQGNYIIHSLRIYNRDESMCNYFQSCLPRLAGFRVHVSDKINTTAPETRYKLPCHIDDEIPVPAIIDVNCTSSLVGRYVTISLNRTSPGYLTLCEVEIYGFNLSSDSVVLPMSLTEVTNTEQYVEQVATTSSIELDTDKSLTSLQSTSPVSQTQFKTTSHLQTDSVNTSKYVEQPAITSIFVPGTDKSVFIPLPRTSPQYRSSDTQSEFETTSRLQTDSISTGKYLEQSATTHLTPHSDESPRGSGPEMVSTPGFSNYITGETTRSTSPTVHQKCCCSSGRKPPVTDPDSNTFMSSVLSDLDIDKKIVAKERRKYMSMPDDRMSSAALSVSFMAATLALCGIILCDVKKVLQDVKGLGSAGI